MKIKDISLVNPKSNRFKDFINYIDTSSVLDGTISNVQRIENDYPSRAQRELNVNDILISSVRPNLRHNCFIKKPIEHGIASTGFIQIRVNNDKWLSSFIYYFLTTNKMIEHYTNIANSSTTTFPAFNKEVIEQIGLPQISLEEQRHIVDTIGSVDSLIELNQEKISKIKRLATQKYEFLYKTYPKSAIGKRLKFIKGKQPKFASKEDGEPYLIIDDLASNIHTQFSSEGLVCDENDVLMVMDGASSGKVFTGNKGYVGSTLAKLSSPQIKPSILYFGLSKFEEEIMKNTTGSAIPHTDKSFVSELRIVDDLDDKTTDFFNFCLNQICNLRTQNSLLYIQKEILLKKYFH